MSLDISLDAERALRFAHMAVGRVQYSPVEEVAEHWAALVEALAVLNAALPGDFYAAAEARMDDDDLVPTFVTRNTPPEDVARAVFEGLLAGRASWGWLTNFVTNLTSLRSAVEMLSERCPHYDTDEQTWHLPNKSHHD